MTDRGVAIVTGGASGTGLAAAKALLGDGWKLVIADLASGPIEAARAQLEPVRANATKCVVMDVANEASVMAYLDGGKRPDGLRTGAAEHPGQRHRARTGHILNVDGGFAAGRYLPVRA